MKDFYQILGKDSNCSQDEIRNAHRRLTIKLHPRLYKKEQAVDSRISDIREAFETLNDPFKRAAYDRDLKRYRSHNPKTLYGKPVYSKQTKRIDLGIIVTLLVIALVLGNYALNTLGGFKPLLGDTTAVVNKIALQVVSRHNKIRHGGPAGLYISVIKPNISGVVNMRRLGTYSSAIVKVIPANSRVTVLKKGSSFYQIAFNHISGFVPKSTLETE